jgi:ABC-type transport system involved in cytochrome c biogenesis ATPase subunit
MRQSELDMGADDDKIRDKAMRKYASAEESFQAAGGYAAESEAASLAASVGLTVDVLAQTLGTLSGGQRRRIELARILFSGSSSWQTTQIYFCAFQKTNCSSALSTLHNSHIGELDYLYLGSKS